MAACLLDWRQFLYDQAGLKTDKVLFQYQVTSEKGSRPNKVGENRITGNR
jgi:hypothetical protein